MKTLLILRHAKSSWDHSGLVDHDRPLNARGLRDCPRMGALLMQEGLKPDKVLSSTALRAKTTAQRVMAHSGYTGEIVLLPELYHAEPATYLQIAAQQAYDINTLMLVGHNPGMEELVSLLADQPHIMPTAGLVQLELPIDSWKALDEHTRGTLVQFWRPKGLR